MKKVLTCLLAIMMATMLIATPALASPINNTNFENPYYEQFGKYLLETPKISYKNGYKAASFKVAIADNVFNISEEIHGKYKVLTISNGDDIATIDTRTNYVVDNGKKIHFQITEELIGVGDTYFDEQVSQENNYMSNNANVLSPRVWGLDDYDVDIINWRFCYTKDTSIKSDVEFRRLSRSAFAAIIVYALGGGALASWLTGEFVGYLPKNNSFGNAKVCYSRMRYYAHINSTIRTGKVYVGLNHNKSRIGAAYYKIGFI